MPKSTINIYNTNMKNKIFLSTFNENKIIELSEFCKIKYENYEIVKIMNLKDKLIDPIEDGLTYKENAILKAKSYKDQLIRLDLFSEGDLILSEDSGIEGVNTEYPGIYSKREVSIYGLIPVLEKLIELNGNDINVKYISNIVVIDSKDEIVLREATEEGTLLLEPLGENNYYLDRYFVSNERGPLGLLEPEIYKKSSYRLKAKIKDI